MYMLHYLRYLRVNDVTVLASSSKSIHLIQKLPSLLNLIKNCTGWIKCLKLHPDSLNTTFLETTGN